MFPIGRESDHPHRFLSQNTLPHAITIFYHQAHFVTAPVTQNDLLFYLDRPLTTDEANAIIRELLDQL
jgi:hypothetical protein